MRDMILNSSCYLTLRLPMSQPGGSEKALMGLLGNAINVYKSNSDGTNTKPLVLGSNGEVSNFNCNPGSVE